MERLREDAWNFKLHRRKRVKISMPSEAANELVANFTRFVNKDEMWI